ncbi:MAG: aminodeoxychorismate synthase component I [Pseudomonadota bacterium]
MQAVPDTDKYHVAPGADCHVRDVPRTLGLVALHTQFPQHYPHLLQSADQGRFDILFACPGDSLVLHASGELTGWHGTSGANDFLASLDDWWSTQPAEQCEQQSLPFTGGWFVYLGYELAGQIEPRLQLPVADNVMPVAIATRFGSAIIHDRESGATVIMAEPGYTDCIAQIEQDIANLPAADATDRVDTSRNDAIEEAQPGQYLDAIARIHHYIREGDVFQVNLSRHWQLTAEEPVDVAALYRNLRQQNPSPFGGIARWDTAAIVSSSPERLVRVQGRMVETRPIAGTRPRSDSNEADAAWAQELLAHPKERAEHIMLIDLERNDLGRICKPGTVNVDEFMVLESYAHVHHIVSNVRGELRPEVTPGQVIRAVFPGGTITGCPKVRCMEIIAELEQQPRGAYTGSMGYINRDGSMDLNILIRTMTVTDKHIHLRAGAGIVADSVAAAELEETRAKARGLLRALGATDS